jgi:hypothetical protein
MTDQDYIRKAVELADGWDLFQDVDCLYIDVDGRTFEEDHQLILDALAAQLVRQVDAQGEEVWVCSTEVEITDMQDRLILIEGPDRTLNTIKAIVESGVLETDDE